MTNTYTLSLRVQALNSVEAVEQAQVEAGLPNANITDVTVERTPHGAWAVEFTVEDAPEPRTPTCTYCGNRAAYDFEHEVGCLMVEAPLGTDPNHERGQVYVDTGLCQCSEAPCIARRSDLAAIQTKENGTPETYTLPEPCGATKVWYGETVTCTLYTGHKSSHTAERGQFWSDPVTKPDTGTAAERARKQSTRWTVAEAMSGTVTESYDVLAAIRVVDDQYVALVLLNDRDEVVVWNVRESGIVTAGNYFNRDRYEEAHAAYISRAQRQALMA